MDLLNHKFIKPFKNTYILIATIFLIWMLFFDGNSWLIHHDLNNEIDDLKQEKKYYIKEINKDKNAFDKLNTEEGIEKFGREEYYLKRENEAIYIIEYQDSIKPEADD